MPEPVAPGDVAATIDPRGIFASADATVKEKCTAAPTATEGRFVAPTAYEAEEESAAAEGRDAAPTEEGSLEAQAGSPPGGIRRGPRVQSRPLRIFSRNRRGFRAQSRPTY